ncbi:MAG: hypothetical protein H7124_01300 [Phycisphaerales bacterium]|nr:hypothetical protein [Hyphomonadaceae bacterium]
MAKARERRVTVEVRSTDSGWWIAVSTEAPGLFAADRSRDGVRGLLPKALADALGGAGQWEEMNAPNDARFVEYAQFA